MSTNQCPFCQKEMPAESAFCLYCMEKLGDAEAAKNSVKKQGRIKPFPAIAFCALLVAVSILLTAWITNTYRGNTPNNNPGNTSDEGEKVVAWTMKLRPNGGIDTFAFCKERGIIGFGWGLQGQPASVLDFRTLRQQEEAYPGDDYLNAMLDDFENMTSGDYVNLAWTTDPDGNFYICEITGPYQYSKEETHDMAGIVNFAACTFYRIGSADLVPQEVFEGFDANGVSYCLRTQAATDATKLLWQAAKAVNDTN